MNFLLGLRTLALLAFVAASTVAIVRPDLVGLGGAHAPAATTLLLIGAAQHDPENHHGQA